MLQGDWSSDVCSSDLISLCFLDGAFLKGCGAFPHLTNETRVFTLALGELLGFLLFRILVHRCDLSALNGHTRARRETDRKSTRLNSSHLVISYAVFCL